jgi:hypothetical protein
VLHDIAVGPFAEQPAGKIAPPLAVRAAAHVELHESAGFLHIFPGRAGFASLQPHDRVAHAQRFARLHRQVAGQAVALVQKADDGTAFPHRGAGQGATGGRLDRQSFDLYRATLVCGRHVILAARRQRQGAAQHGQADNCLVQDRRDHSRRTPGHAASGLHAS